MTTTSPARPRRGVLHELIADALELTRAREMSDNPGLVSAIVTDSYRITCLQRWRELATRLRVPGLNHVLRVTQTALLGIELGQQVTLGHGVYFVHPVGVVIGGDSKIGDRVRFYGSNTVGTVRDDGYPTIEDDVWVGAGARILGPVTIGARSHIGANAVVLIDVPPDSVAMGVPAKVSPRRAPRTGLVAV